MADAMGDFAAMDAAPSGAPPAPAPKPVAKPAEPSAAAGKEPAKPESTPPEKPPEQPAKPIEEPVRPVKAAELRTAYEGLKKKVKDELEPEVQRLRARVQEFESKPPEDAAAIQARIKSVEDRNAELERHIAFVDYTHSAEYRTKYEQPYTEAWNDAVADFRQLTVREQTGEDDFGRPQVKVRPATEDDLIKLGAMNLSEMDEAAQQMFGASAPRAVGHIQNLRKLANARNAALETAKTKAQEFKAQRETEFKASHQALAKHWEDVNQSLEQRFPSAFKPEDGNAEDKAGHTKGFALANLLFLGPQSLTPEQIESLPATFKDTLKAGQPLSDQQRVQLHALARIKMANHDRKVVALKKAQDRIAELEKALAEFEKSEPGGGRTAPAVGADNRDPMAVVEDELQALDRKG